MLEVRTAAIDSSEAVTLLAELDAEYVRRWGHGDHTLVVPDEFTPPRGEFFVAWLDDEPVGIGGWRIDGASGGGSRGCTSDPTPSARAVARVVARRRSRTSASGAGVSTADRW